MRRRRPEVVDPLRVAETAGLVTEGHGSQQRKNKSIVM